MTLTYRKAIHGSYGAPFTETEALCPRCDRWSIILADFKFCPWPHCGFEVK